MKVNIDIADQRIKDLLCSAFEGGSNYWIRSVTPFSKADRDPRAEYWHETPLYDQTISIVDDESGLTHVLTLKKLKQGLKRFATKYPKHFGDFLNENDDAITADVYLQCCLFKDAIYG